MNLNGVDPLYMSKSDNRIGSAVFIHVPGDALKQKPYRPEIHGVWPRDVRHVPGGHRLADEVLMHNHIDHGSSRRCGNVLRCLEPIGVAELDKVQVMALAAPKGHTQRRELLPEMRLVRIAHQQSRDHEVIRRSSRDTPVARLVYVDAV